MPRRPLPPPDYTPEEVKAARTYLLKYYPAQAAGIKAMRGDDAVACQRSREKAFAAVSPDAPRLTRPKGVRAATHAKRTGAVGGHIGGRILTPASLAARRASSKLGGAARSEAARLVREGVMRAAWAPKAKAGRVGAAVAK